MCPLTPAADADPPVGSIHWRETMRESSSRFGRFVACGAIVIGLASQALLSRQAEAVPGLQRTTGTSVSDSSTSKTVAARCPLASACSVAAVRSRAVAARWSWSSWSRFRPPSTIVSWSVRARMGAATRGTGGWPPTRCAPARFRATGSSPRRRAARDSNTPQNTISFCIGQPEVEFGGRVNRRRRTNSSDQPGTPFQRHRGLHLDRRAGMPTALPAPGL